MPNTSYLKATSHALEESEKLTTSELQECQVLRLSTDPRRSKNQMLEQSVDCLISGKLEMTTSLSLLNAKLQQLAPSS